MDEELFGSNSALRSSFERMTTQKSKNGVGGNKDLTGDGGDDEVDLDFNLLKNLLESHAMALESNGAGLSPAEILLSHFGIDMPTPFTAASVDEFDKNVTKG